MLNWWGRQLIINKVTQIIEEIESRDSAHVVIQKMEDCMKNTVKQTIMKVYTHFYQYGLPTNHIIPFKA